MGAKPPLDFGTSSAIIQENVIRTTFSSFSSLRLTYYVQRFLYFMRILLTNDDGIFSPGLSALAQELAPLGEIYIVAPMSEQSGVAHTITFLSALKTKEVYQDGRFWGWAVEGSPADCVRIGVQAISELRPDLVVSGINSGWNAGVNFHYSGTCAAAKEARLFGINSFAVSIQSDAVGLYRPAAALFKQIIQQTLEQQLDSPCMYNVNAPNEAVRQFAQGVMPTLTTAFVDTQLFGERLARQKSPFGMPYYWCEANRPEIDALTPGSDLYNLFQGMVTITPIDVNPTERRIANEMSNWRWSFQPESAGIDERAENEGLDGQTLNPDFVPGTHIRRMPRQKSALET